MTLNGILGIIAAAVMLILVTSIIWLLLANAHLRAQIATLQGHISACTIANQDMRDKVSQQNAAIQSWRHAETERAARAAQNLRQAQKRAAVWMRQADAWLKIQVTGDDCIAAQKLVGDFAAQNAAENMP
ncbi:MAG: hypothetical protein JO126_04625 [Alphaproteobacteria bacterium]|nr:hypothetical protein [Alphaproteobacteria bacterium]MBV8548722.1 hypothetical protein [Alphaproteobacteria bacterium]